jgi:branched-chain amino acid transport system permease protein
VRAFVISAALAGLAGSLSTMVFQLATLAGVEWQNSGEAILMSLVGGIGTLAGPAVGATVIIGLRTFLATMDVPTTFIIGFIFVACVILFRRGIAGEIIAGMRWDKPRA